MALASSELKQILITVRAKLVDFEGAQVILTTVRASWALLGSAKWLLGRPELKVSVFAVP